MINIAIAAFICVFFSIFCGWCYCLWVRKAYRELREGINLEINLLDARLSALYNFVLDSDKDAHERIKALEKEVFHKMDIYEPIAPDIKVYSVDASQNLGPIVYDSSRNDK